MQWYFIVLPYYLSNEVHNMYVTIDPLSRCLKYTLLSVLIFGKRNGICCWDGVGRWAIDHIQYTVNLGVREASTQESLVEEFKRMRYLQNTGCRQGIYQTYFIHEKT